MNYFGFTHFNNSTYEENKNYKKRNKYKCIYGVPKCISSKTPYESNIYVFEMNNEINELMGIGKITNYPRLDKKYKIYDEQNYNRYIYIGNEHITRDTLLMYENGIEIVNYFDNKLFKGTKHRKRGQGIGIIENNYYIENSINYLDKIIVLFKTINK